MRHLPTLCTLIGAVLLHGMLAACGAMVCTFDDGCSRITIAHESHADAAHTEPDHCGGCPVPEHDACDDAPIVLLALADAAEDATPLLAPAPFATRSPWHLAAPRTSRVTRPLARPPAPPRGSIGIIRLQV